MQLPEAYIGVGASLSRIDRALSTGVWLLRPDRSHHITAAFTAQEGHTLKGFHLTNGGGQDAIFWYD